MTAALRLPLVERADFHSRFARIARAFPGSQALSVDGQAVSYGELLEKIERCAAGLYARGCGIGSPIAVALPNSLDFVAITFATLAIGGILVPLNPKFKEDELRHYIETSAPQAVFYPPELEELITPLVGRETVRAHSASEVAADRPFVPPPFIDQAAPALYMFSSGSTGKSKRVTRSQANLLAEYEAMVRTAGHTSDDRILCTVPLYHAHGFNNAMVAALLSGASLVLATAEFNPRSTMSLLVSEGVTVYPAVPFMFKMLCDTRFSERPDLSRLRLAFSAGAPLPEVVSARFAQLYGKTIGQLYGSTETGAITLNVQRQADKPGSVGRPIDGFEVQIREEDGDISPVNETGEIWIRTPAMTKGYDGLPEMTEQCFSGEYFFAGDLGHLDADGYLYVTGRKKLLINVAGYKVDPLEVEEVLARHPKIADSVVVGVEHAGYGEKIKAVVVPRAGAESCSASEVIEFASQNLAEYKVPKMVEFREDIPRSPLGKILRKYL